MTMPIYAACNEQVKLLALRNTGFSRNVCIFEPFTCLEKISQRYVWDQKTVFMTGNNELYIPRQLKILSTHCLVIFLN